MTAQLRESLGHVELQLDTQRQLNQVGMVTRIRRPVQSAHRKKLEVYSLQTSMEVYTTHDPSQTG